MQDASAVKQTRDSASKQTLIFVSPDKGESVACKYYGNSVEIKNTFWAIHSLNKTLIYHQRTRNKTLTKGTISSSQNIT